MKRPHIVIFVADEFRADRLGHIAGTPSTLTPHLDHLAETEAVSFTANFCQNPVCTPSRCSFMSGWYPHVRGHRTMHHMLRPEDQDLLKIVKDAGYYVWWGGKNDLLPGTADLSEHVSFRNTPCPEDGLAQDPHMDMTWRGPADGPKYYSFLAGTAPATEPSGDRLDFDLWNVRSAVRFLETYDRPEPFLLYLSIQSPHPPYYAEEKWLDNINEDNRHHPIPQPDWELKPQILPKIQERRRMDHADPALLQQISDTYDAMCMRVDHQAGMILDALRNAGLYEDTAFFFMSDHGDFAGDYGLVEKTQNTFEDCLTHTPMILKPPAGYDCAPGIRTSLTENIDLFATVLELTGASPTLPHFGRSLLPALPGETLIRHFVHTEGGRLLSEMHCREAESPGATDPTDLYWPRVGLQQENGTPMYHTKACMIRNDRYKYVRRLYEADEFYDLLQDPDEIHNLIHDPRYKDMLGYMRDKMLSFYMETSDIVPFIPDAR